GARTLHHGFGVVGNVVGLQTVILCVLEVVKNFRRSQQRLGRDTTPVEANAAEIVALDDRRLETEMSRANGRDVAAGAGTDDQDIKIRVSHTPVRLRRGPN